MLSFILSSISGRDASALGYLYVFVIFGHPLVVGCRGDGCNWLWPFKDSLHFSNETGNLSTSGVVGSYSR